MKPADGSQEMESIGIGPRHVDFGTIRISAIETRHISVLNPLRRHLHVVLAADRLPELSLTEPVSQVREVCSCILRELVVAVRGDPS